MSKLCIYHGNCADGFTAAWVVRKALGDIEFHAGVYQAPPPDVKGKDVILVDFSYKRDVVLQMAREANSLIILDHHKSAASDLTPLDSNGYIHDISNYQGVVDWARYQQDLAIDQMENAAFTAYTYFDMERSGAGLAWDFFFPNQARPALINHVEDRDLWRFRLPNTREIQANIFSYPYEFDVWDRLVETDCAELAIEGKAIERKHFKDIAELLRVVTRKMVIGGIEVPVANLPYIHVSDAAHSLAETAPFAACYWDTPEGRVFGLRSREDGADVSEIAKLYGGGGHKHAAGFKVPFEVAAGFEIKAA
jgi:oligoribonuclease NrnB/cAMP/cGMP phosphodiesterase (DHH superfamily)